MASPSLLLRTSMILVAKSRGAAIKNEKKNLDSNLTSVTSCICDHKQLFQICTLLNASLNGVTIELLCRLNDAIHTQLLAQWLVYSNCSINIIITCPPGACPPNVNACGLVPFSEVTDTPDNSSTHCTWLETPTHIITLFYLTSGVLLHGLPCSSRVYQTSKSHLFLLSPIPRGVLAMVLT